jgi:glycosyltransferase involved in cell wall biosynthesis
MPSLIKNKAFLCGCLKRFDRIYVETSVMRDLLISMGFLNILIMSNCKPLKIVEKKDLHTEPNKPLKFCLFSRIMKQKGVEHAIYAINQLNSFYGANTCSLDIYGQIDEREIAWFENLQKKFSEYISYGGVVDFDKSVDTLKCYDALIFPTLFYTEGIPGTVIDAYAAGIPVISSRWASFSDVINEGIVGFGYEFGSQDALFELMKNIVSCPSQLVEMKCSCVEKAENFLPCNAMRVLKNNLN